MKKEEIIDIANTIIKDLIEEMYMDSITCENGWMPTKQYKDRMKKHYEDKLKRNLIKED